MHDTYEVKVKRVEAALRQVVWFGPQDDALVTEAAELAVKAVENPDD